MINPIKYSCRSNIHADQIISQILKMSMTHILIIALLPECITYKDLIDSPSLQRSASN